MSWLLASRSQLELIAKMWHRSQIDHVEVREIRSSRDGGGPSWHWNAACAVVMRDGTEILLPPDGDAASGRGGDDLEKFLTELRSGDPA